MKEAAYSLGLTQSSHQASQSINWITVVLIVLFFVLLFIIIRLLTKEEKTFKNKLQGGKNGRTERKAT